jgi:hypothetical protein
MTSTQPIHTAQLAYSLLCDDIRLEAGNKLSLMGIFQNVYFQSLPATILKFALLNHWVGAGEHSTEIRIISPDRSRLLLQTTPSNFTLEGGGFADHVPPPKACAPSPAEVEFTELGVRVHTGTIPTPGTGTAHHMAMELFKLQAKVSITHIPFSGTAGAVNAVLAGDVPLMFLPVHVAMAQVKGGRLVALAAAGDKRSALAPEVPTLTELGIKMGEESSWYAFFAPKGTPRPIIDKINRDLEKVLAMPEMKERGTQLGYRFIGGSPEKLAAHLKSEIAKWDALEKKGAFK